MPGCCSDQLMLKVFHSVPLKETCNAQLFATSRCMEEASYSCWVRLVFQQFLQCGVGEQCDSYRAAKKVAISAFDFDWNDCKCNTISYSTQTRYTTLGTQHTTNNINGSLTMKCSFTIKIHHHAVRSVTKFEDTYSLPKGHL